MPVGEGHGQGAGVLVIGAGIMGHGIAEACAIAGFDVYLKDTNREILDRAVHLVGDSLEILARKRRLRDGDTPGSVLARLHLCTGNDELGPGIGVVIEAVPEVLAVKEAALSAIAPALPPGTIVATNSSTIPVSRVAGATGRPGLAIGMHFFNPVPLMHVVEIVPGPETSAATVARATALARAIGKVPVPVFHEPPGFIVNRVQAATQVLVNRLVARGLATFNQVDALARRKNLPMGPFEVYDFAGLDTVKGILDYLAGSVDPEFAPPAWLDDLVAAGQLGRKTCKGIHDWRGGQPVIDLDDATTIIDVADLLAVQANEACKLIAAGCVQDPVDVDVAIMLGTGNKSGILGLLSTGRERIVARLHELASMLGTALFEPHPLLATLPVPNSYKEARARLKAIQARP